MVQDVEHLDAELRADALGKFNVFEDREVHVKQSRADDLVASKAPNHIGLRREW